MNVFWFIPTHGDTRYLGTSEGARAADYPYFQQIASAADTLGYEGVLLPTGRSCEDAWVVASSLIPVTKRLKFLVAIRPGIASPGLSARMAATFDRLSGGRLLINVVTGGDTAELEGDGLFVDHDTRYEITGEFLHIWRGLLAGAQLNRQATDPAEYIELLARPGYVVDAWETSYLHVLPGENPVFEWAKGSTLRPVLAVLDQEQADAFLREYGERVRDAYPPHPFGTIFPFRRVFTVAHRVDPQLLNRLFQLSY